MIRGQRAVGGDEFAAVVEAGGVAVMAIGNVDMLSGDHLLDVGNDRRVGDRPEVGRDQRLAVLRRKIRRGQRPLRHRAAHRFEQEAGDVVCRVVVEAEDRRQV